MKILNFSLYSQFLFLIVVGCGPTHPEVQKTTSIDSAGEEVDCYKPFEMLVRENLVNVAVEFAKVASRCSPDDTEKILLKETHK